MAERAEAGRLWAMRQALPLWAGAGFDPALGLYVERLDLTGAPVADAPRRLTTQARQIYTFAHAALLGWWPDGRAQAVAAAHAMIDRYLSPDGAPGWIFSIGPGGGPADVKRELYAHAFALFGLAWAFRLDPDPRFAEARDATLRLLEEKFAGPGGGYISVLGDGGRERLQNPHMHLLEAMLAWHEATGDATFLARAGEIGDLFVSRFYQAEPGVLVEYFGPGWSFFSGERGRIVEPGHHFEWVWLLHRLGQAGGRGPGGEAERLYAHACRHGYDAEGLIVERVAADGAVLAASRRTWPHTEAIKAHAVMCEQGVAAAEMRCAKTWDAMFENFLSGAAAGGWRDHLDGGGALLSDYMPASTLYHVFCAIAEAGRVWRS